MSLAEALETLKREHVVSINLNIVKDFIEYAQKQGIIVGGGALNIGPGGFAREQWFYIEEYVDNS